MTLILQLSPEREAALKTHAQAQGVSAEQYALELLDRGLQPASSPRRHISQVMRELVGEVPKEMFESFPTDGASEHDHYLYGSPKKHP